MPIQAQTPIVQIGSAEVLPGAAVSFAGMLRSGQTLTGTPTITVSPATSTITCTSPTVSSTALTINGVSVATGEAVQFTLSGNAAPKGCYTVSISVSTSNSGTLQGVVQVKVI